MKQKFPDLKTTHPTHPEVLALHYTKAGNIVQAIRYWDEAGRKADEPGAKPEAIAHWTKALELLKNLPNH